MENSGRCFCKAHHKNIYSHEHSTLASADYLDILFDGRNKTYGAFELRRHYAKRTRRALGVVLGVSCLMAVYPLFAHNSSVIRPPHETVINLKNVPDVPHPVKKVEVRPTQPAHVQAPAPPHINLAPPAIVPDADVVKPLVTIDSVKDILIASTTGDGLKGATGTEFGPKIGGDGPPTVDPPKIGSGRDPHEIAQTVDQKPSFNGNIDTWLSSHLEYPERAVSEGAQGSVMMQFVVNEDGSISDVTTLSGAGHGFEAEAARVIKMMPRWKPAKLNGEAVRTWFRLPVVFALAEN